MEAPKLGQLADASAGRDAVHIAIAPVVAGEWLGQGTRVVLEDGLAVAAVYDSHAIGIVDPFLPKGVDKGERFYLCLFPGTVTSLRHVWTSPAFAPKVPKGADRE